MAQLFPVFPGSNAGASLKLTMPESYRSFSARLPRQQCRGLYLLNSPSDGGIACWLKAA